MIIAEYLEKIRHHELQAAHAEEERRLLQGQLWRQKLEFREAHQQSLKEMKELQKFQSSTFDTIARRKLIEDQNTILEFSGRVQELQNEVNCMNDSKDFQDAESVRSGNSHITGRSMSFPTHPIPEGMLRHSFISPSRREGPPSIWDTHGTSGNVFADPHASSSAPQRCAFVLPSGGIVAERPSPKERGFDDRVADARRWGPRHRCRRCRATLCRKGRFRNSWERRLRVPQHLVSTHIPREPGASNTHCTR